MRFTRSYLLLFFYCSLSIASFAQKITTFQHTYKNTSNGDYYEIGTSIVPLPDKGFIIAGVTGSVIYQNDPQILILRLDSLGKIIWSKIFWGNTFSNISGEDWSADLVMTPDGNVVVGSNTGSKISMNRNFDAAFLFKIDLNGKVLWSKIYSTSVTYPGFTIQSVIANNNGGCLMAGYAELGSTIYASSIVIKTNAAGGITWAKSYYDSINMSYFANSSFRNTCITKLKDDGYIIGGNNDFNINNYHNDYQILKIDKNGKLLWSKSYGASNSESITSIAELPDKSIYAFGYYAPGIPLTSSPYGGSIQKLDSLGNVLWSKKYDFGPNNASNGAAFFGLPLYDSAKRVFDFPVYNIAHNSNINSGIMSIDTAGILKLIKLHNNNVDYTPIVSASTHNFLRLQSGDFALLSSSSRFGLYTSQSSDLDFLKTDSNGSSNGCNMDTITPIVSNYPVQDRHYGIMAQTNLKLEIDTGCSVYNYPHLDSMVCPPFVANFSVQNNCQNQPTQFLDSSFYKPINWKWDFGDKGSGSLFTSTAQNPTHQYAYPGTYQVKLVASNGTVKDSITRTVTIYPLPTLFKFDTTICAGSTISLHATGGAKYLWEPVTLVSDSTSATPLATLKRTTTFIVQAISINDCLTYDTVHVTVDPKPNPPKINYATVKSNAEIDLKFQKSDSNDVKQYEIYRYINGANYQKLATINNVSNKDTTYLYKDNTVTANIDTYSYKIMAIDSCGAASDTTNFHQPVLLKINRVGCKQSVALNWTNYIGWASVSKQVIYRSVNNGPDSLLAELGNGITVYTDTALNHINSYCYKIISYDGADSFISQSNIACATTFFPGAAQVVAASKISTSVTNGVVVIHWQSINKPNFAYNRLFYSADGKSFILLKDSIPPTIDSFVQTGTNTQTEDQYYYLTTVDSCGQESAKSIVQKTMTLTVSVGQLVHKLNWTPYKGFKIEKYEIEKLINGQFQIIDSVSGTDTATSYFPAPCNSVERYRIAVIGYNPGELSWSDTMGKQAIDTIPSDKPIMTNVTVLNAASTQISFIGSHAPDTYKFAIQRSINGNWGTAGSILFTKPGDSLTFSDTITNSINNKICYTVIALDSCLNATPSDTVCALNVAVSSLFCTKQALLTWTGCNNTSSCPNAYIIFRSIDAINYVQIAKLNAGTSTYSDTSVKVGTKYYYKVEGLSSKTGITSFSDTIRTTPQIIPTADNAQFVYATVQKTDPKYGQIYVAWRRAAPTDTNARGYYLYSYDTTNKKYALLKDITDLNDTSYINSNINTLQSTYKYYIITYNVCDVGNISNIHKTILLSINNGNLLANLHWTNYLGEPVTTYFIYKSIDGGKPILLQDAGLDTTYLDTNLYCNHTYTYQIQAILANGKISFSDSVTIKGNDTIKPITKPLSLATVIQTGTSNGKVQLSWQAAISPLGVGGRGGNLAGYNIFRSNDGINWQQIQNSYPGLSLIDSGLNTYRQSYYYRIQAVDSCGNLGAFSPIHKTINLKATAGNQFIQLNWNAYQGWKVKQYLVYKDGNLIATIGKDTTNFMDTLVVCTTTYHYLIKAIADTTNDTLISASNTDSVKSFDHKAPQKVYIKTVTVSNPNKAVTITWNPSASFDTKNYFIYRKSALDGSMVLIDTTNQTTYVDSTDHIVSPLGVGGNGVGGIGGDCYYIFAQDHCGNISPGSNEGCIIILNAQNQQFYNDLSWNGYQTWYDGIQSYNVYKKEDPEPSGQASQWNLIGTTTNGNIRNFTDKDLGDSTINFCYQVEAVENPGKYNQLSRSTVACVHQGATVFIPNSFTHFNLDGLNDYFGPKGLYIKNYTMQIYNRWGELVYSTSTGKPWDGTFKGAEALEGVYIYLITIEDYNAKKSNFNGNITVFR